MINLFKGQKVDLTKGRPGMTKILVGLGWDTKKYDGGYDFDLDASAFLLGDNGKVPADSDFVFYGHLDHESGAVQHMGDNLKGKLPGSDANDCEQIKIDLAAIPANIAKIAITVTIYEAEERHQNFGQVSNAYVHIYDETNERELIRYDLGEDFSVETAVIVGEIYRSDVEWKFNAIGAGFQGGLRGLCLNLGVNV